MTYSKQHVLISVNPKAGRTSPALRAEQLRDALQKRGFIVELSTDLPTICTQANDLHAEGKLRCLLGVGGDGTAAALVNQTNQGVPVSLLPAGTANLLAKHYRLPFRPEKMASVIQNGKIITIDGGLANGRLFLVMIGAGFDADVVRQVHRAREEAFRAAKKHGAHISYFSYIKPIFHSLFKYRFPAMRVEACEPQKPNIPKTVENSNWGNLAAQRGGDITEGEASSPIRLGYSVWENQHWVFIFNLNRYGWGLPMVPAARGDDGKLDHCLLRGASVPHGFWFTAWIQVFAAHRWLKSAQLGQSARYRITSEKADVPYQLDGDPGGVLPVEVETLEKRITLLVP